jgi:hypothetical protein
MPSFCPKLVRGWLYGGGLMPSIKSLRCAVKPKMRCINITVRPATIIIAKSFIEAVVSSKIAAKMQHEQYGKMILIFQ